MEAQSLTALVLEHLRSRIITGELEPEKRLNENDLAAKLEISRHPIREAFRILESERLVYSVPRKGVYVTGLSTKDMIEVYQAREMIECYAVDLISQKNDTDLTPLKSAILDAAKLTTLDGEDPHQYLLFHKALSGFHSRLIELSDNTKLVYFYGTISLNLARYQFKHLRLSGSLDQAIEEHRLVCDALEKNDYQLAKERLRLHINKRLKGIAAKGLL